ncbi:hypothetical protein Slala03_75610 [Streptomyces lavendulae subsp. lavendulae]|nr:hypothetical protein Slala03_75610 [Streptomyces lavendulae subsp. lavendulae]
MFDHLDVVDAAFDGAGVPLAGQALGHGVPVLLQTGRERVEVGKFLGSRADDPVLQMLAGAGGEDPGEAADETLGCREFRAARRP